MPVWRRSIHRDEYSVLETLAEHGVAVAPFATAVENIADIGLPAVVVARYADMSPVRRVVVKYGDIVPALAHAAKAHGFFMQKHVGGHEVACGVIMDGRKILPLVPVETIPRSLHESGAWHMPSAVQDAVQATAKAAHAVLGVKGHSCVRMVVNGVIPYVTGVDMSPSLARTSLFMRSALLAGLTVHEICEYPLKITL